MLNFLSLLKKDNTNREDETKAEHTQTITKNKLDFPISKDILFKLQNSNIENTKWFSLTGTISLCKCVDVYDGDTLTIIIPFNNNIYKKKCRLKGIDCAELRSKNIEEKKIAEDTKKVLEDFVLNKMLYVKCDKEDKYGRSLVELYLTEKDLEMNINSINNKLIEMKLAYEYDGKSKKLFENWFDNDSKKE